MAGSDAAASFIASLRGVEVTRDATALRALASDVSGRTGAVPLAIIRPRDAQQVQRVFKAAIAAGVPLIPVSSPAGPRRRGDTISDVPSVVVDLSAMNAVMNVDGRDAVAMIEPGVTFAHFAAALQPHGLRPYQPLRPRASKSALAAFLEREPMTVPARHWDSTDPLAAMEIVFGDGELFRTGTAAMPGKLADNLATGNRMTTGLGPVHLDFGRVVQGAQGSLGIVTWATIFCQRVPALEVPLFAGGASLEPLIELAYRLLRRRINGQLFILNAVQLALLLARDAAHYATLKAALPPWILYFELTAPAYFPGEAIAYQRALLDTDAARLGVDVTTTLGGEPASSVAAAQGTYDDVSDARRLGLADHELMCMSQLNRVSAQLVAVGAPPAGAEWAIYLQPMTQGVNAQCQLSVVGRDGDFTIAIRRAAAALADNGAFFSRPYFPYADIPFDRDPAAIRFLARTKKLLDPNAVLQRGALALGEAA